MGQGQIPPRAPIAGEAGLRLQIFEEFRVWVGAQAVPESTWRRRKAGALVKLLALAPGRSLSRDELMEALWPDAAPETAADNLRQALYVARAALAGHAALARRGEQLALSPDGDVRIDAADFARAAAVARAGDDPATHEAALALYTGDLLPEDRYEDWAAGPRETLRATYLALLERAAHLYTERGDGERALTALERLTAAEPVHEEAQAALMRAHALAGRRGRALQVFARLWAALRHELDIAPAAATVTLHRAIADGSFPGQPASPPAPVDHDPAAAPRRDNLPAPLTSFIGRVGERAALAARLTDNGCQRLLTLTGAGGCGKTRLALAVARDLAAAGAYPDGIWLVELAALADPLLVPGAVAAALGIREEAGRPLRDTLAEGLRAKRSLLVLDNCEHLADACADLAATLLAAAPGLRLLATSRVALRVSGAAVRRVPSLPLPAAAAGDPAASLGAIGASDAVQLFVDRSRRRRPEFALTRDNAAAVAAICHRLDGLPLALELAAARIELLPPAALAVRLDDALAVLNVGDRSAPSRQRTLRATLDWSHALLREDEQILLRRLAPFNGGFVLDAAEAVCADDLLASGAVLGSLAGLLDQSLVLVREEAGEARFTLLETVRQYAAERLDAAGETAAVRERHAAYYVALAETADPALQGPEQGVWLARLEREHDNLRAVQHRALAGGGDLLTAETVLRLGWALRQFWVMRGYFGEGRRWLEAALARVGPGHNAGTASWRGRGLSAAGRLAWCQGDYIAAQALHTEELALARATGARQDLATALNNVGNALYHQGDFAAARPVYEEGLAIRRALGDRSAIGASLNNLSNVAYDQGDFPGSVAFAEESLAIKRALGDQRGVAITLNNLGNKLYWEGDHAAARALIEESLAIKRELGDRQNIAIALNCLGELALVGGGFAAARAFYAESLTIGRDIDDRWSIAVALEGLAACAATAGWATRAARVWGFTEALRETTNAHMDPASRASHDRTIAAARASVATSTWTAAWQHGRTLSVDEASAAALDTAAARPSGTASPPAIGPAIATLGARERQVAVLVARGQTNAQIAAALSIAPRTADTHVGNILRKLGLTSRAQLTTWLAAQDAPTTHT